MENILTVTLHLPSLTCLVGFVLSFYLKKKNETAYVLMPLAATGLLYYLCDAIIINPYSDVHATVIASAAVPFLSPFSLAFIISLLWVLYYEKHLPWHQYLWFVAPIALCSICTMLYIVIGNEEAAHFQALYDQLRHYPESHIECSAFRCQHFVEEVLYNATLFLYSLYAVLFAIFILYKTGFNHKAFIGYFFKGASLPPMHILLLSFISLMLMVIVRVLVGRYFLFDHTWANILLAYLQAYCIILVTLAAFNLNYVECTLRQYWFIDPNERLDDTVIDDTDDDSSDSNSPDQDSFSRVQERLDKGLHEMMEVQKAFLDSNLRMIDVAHTLCTNRNYLSRHIKERYHMSYNDYIAHLRIEYAKQHMLQHPDMLLDAIAEHCGFGTAQAFGRKFKAVEGITPRTWLVAEKSKH
ncbi:MAG: helix-turn-helix transcriptional regulator [Bacteroidales bacterium]|nr:helix-turn-helix transcriptional regulator [Bacteroidales bacterium]